MSIYEMAMSNVLISYFPPSHMSNLRKGWHVTIMFSLAPVACYLALCRMSNLRNVHRLRHVRSGGEPQHVVYSEWRFTMHLLNFKMMMVTMNCSQ